MDNIPLGHLSRPQLVNLLLRIVDLLSQPLPQPGQPFPPAQATQAYPVLEPYDASIDPWNAPELSQPANVSGPGARCQRTTSGTAHPPGLLNPGAMAFLPQMVLRELEVRASPLLSLILASLILAPSPKLTWLHLPWLAHQRLIPKVKEEFLQVPTCLTTVPTTVSCQVVNLYNLGN